MEVRWGVPIPHSDPVIGPSERCIEIPLGLELLALHEPGWVLDAGCAMNGQLPQEGVASVLHVTQSMDNERLALWGSRRSYFCGDLRTLHAFAPMAFDRTVCVSTLEHVGLDNASYGGPVESDPDSMFTAVDELCRVTRRRLLITVPWHATPEGCAQWRYLTPDNIDAICACTVQHGFTTEPRYYSRNDKGWYGGEWTPVPANTTCFQQQVNAIAAIRCIRE